MNALLSWLRWTGLRLACGLVLLAAGCTSPGAHPPAALAPAVPAPAAANPTNTFVSALTNRINPEWLKPPMMPFHLGPGDHVELEILGRSGSRTVTFVCPDGKLYYDLLPGIDVWGMTLPELRERLESELSKYYAKPHVSAGLTSVASKRVWVMGRLNKPGLIPLTGPMTIIEAVARAGGLFTSRFNGTTEELADLNHSFLIRNGEMMPINFKALLRAGDTSQNVYLEPDDFLYLPSSLSSEIYVLGAVNGPRTVGYVDNMGLTTAIARALGPAPEAYLTHVAVVRGALSDPKILVVDYRAILNGRAPDIRLQAHDIVYVPLSPYRTLERYAKLITDSFVRTVAANEGGHAGNSNFGGIGISTQLPP